jgi:hypothetical protein
MVDQQGVAGENRIPGMVERVVYVGPVIQLLLRLADGTALQSMVPNRGQAVAFSSGAAVTIELPADALRVLEDSGAPAPRDGTGSAPGESEETVPAPLGTQAS